MEQIFLQFPWLKTEYLGNTIHSYLYVAGLFVLLLLVFKLFENILLKRLDALVRRTETDIDDELVNLLEAIPDFYYTYLAFYIAVKFLVLPPIFYSALEVVLIILTVYLLTKVAHELINFALFRAARKKDPKSSHQKNITFYAISLLVTIMLWVTAILLILSNLGVNITAFIASLGIGGIALALAAQNVLVDIFSSFSIYFDKPFEIGDFIVIGEDKGIVKRIGLKTTRLEAMEGQELIIPNRELTSARLSNFRRMKKRHVLFQFIVSGQTPSAKLEKVPGIIRDAIGAASDTEVERANLKSFAPNGIEFEAGYYIGSADFIEFRNVHEQIHFGIKKGLEKADIDLFFPPAATIDKK